QLFINNALDARDELDQKWEKSHQFLTSLTNNLSERDAHDSLSSTVCKGQQEYEDVTIGLLYTILTDENAAQKAYRDLTLLSRDGLTLAFTKLNQLIVEKFFKFQLRTRNQLIWLFTEFVKSSAAGADAMCFYLLRQIIGGDVGRTNIDYIEALLNIFQEHKTWLFSYNFLTAAVVYVFLRLILDHSVPPLHHLMQREIDFCCSTLREKFTDCIQIGRDLIRLLQAVAQIPVFNTLWKDIIHNPRSLSPHFTGISHLLKLRTSRKFLISRITPDMENKLVFLTSKVKLGHQKKYQDWFQKKYLANPESHALLCDIIRFICGVIHPTNEILGSDIIPRWAVIGWLLQCCQNNATSANAKLTLFFDWLCYQPGQENIMNIEPGILIMLHSTRSHITISATLLDFLCRIITSFYKPMETQIRNAVRKALHFVVEKRVLNSLSPLFDHQKLDKELKEMLQYNFPEF
ncbi:uncharacterized protein TRIADDRAFT_11602, partial [Trichoplax adhaerens]